MVDREYIFSSNGCGRDPIIGYDNGRGVIIHDGNGRIFRKISLIVNGTEMEMMIPAFIGHPNRSQTMEERRLFRKLKKEIFITKGKNFGYVTETLWYDPNNLVSKPGHRS
jgi:hypothetical protein